MNLAFTSRGADGYDAPTASRPVHERQPRSSLKPPHRCGQNGGVVLADGWGSLRARVRQISPVLAQVAGEKNSSARRARSIHPPLSSGAADSDERREAQAPLCRLYVEKGARPIIVLCILAEPFHRPRRAWACRRQGATVSNFLTSAFDVRLASLDVERHDPGAQCGCRQCRTARIASKPLISTNGARCMAGRRSSRPRGGTWCIGLMPMSCPGFQDHAGAADRELADAGLPGSPSPIGDVRRPDQLFMLADLELPRASSCANFHPRSRPADARGSGPAFLEEGSTSTSC